MTMEKDIKYALSVVCQYMAAARVCLIRQLAWADVNARVALMVAVREALQDSIDLLCFLGKLDLHE